jgi:hypothetical protein
MNVFFGRLVNYGSCFLSESFKRIAFHMVVVFDL